MTQSTQPSDTASKQEKSNGKTTYIGRRRALQAAAGVSTLSLTGCMGSGGSGGDSDTFKIGVNMELSSGYSELGGSLVNAAELAGEKINDDGGINGQDVEFFVEDNQVDSGVAVEKARKLVQQDNVDVMLGPINSNNRVAISPVAEESETPLLYPIQYEGNAADDYCNEYLVTTSTVPPQQVDPLVPYLMENHGESFYMLGADYTWPREINARAATLIEENGGEVLGEEYVSVGATDFSSILSRIESEDPDVLMMSLVSGSIPAIQKAMFNRGLRENWTEVGLAHGQIELAGTEARHSQGVLNAQPYFPNLDNQANQDFVSSFREQYPDSTLHFLTGPAYTAVNLLRQAVESSGGTSADDILSGFSGLSADSTIMGNIEVPYDNQIRMNEVSLAEVNSDVEFEIKESLSGVMPDQSCEF